MRTTPLPALDYEKMEREIASATDEIRAVASTDHHQINNYPVPAVVEHTALQIIAHGVTRLTWADAEKMGTAIESKVKEGGRLTAAIQDWAKEWESFK